MSATQSFDRVAYMKAYRESYKPRRKALDRERGARENKPSCLGISFSDDPKAYMRAYYEKNREKLLSEGRVRGALWRKENRDYIISRDKNIRVERKQKAFALFGGKCCRCGFSDVRALQIDHINGCTLSHKERNRTQLEAGEKLYRRMLNGEVDLSEYQLLCANCNWIKREEKQECRRKS